MINLLRSLQNKIMLLAGRCVMLAANDALKMQGVQIKLLADETRTAERFQNYGVSSVPLPGAEGVAIAIGGERGHTVVIAMDDRRHRPRGMLPGEVAIYNNTGASVVLKSDGSIIATPALSGKIKIGGSVLTQALPTEAFATVVCGYLATLTAALPVPCPATPDLIPLGLTTKTEAI
jgi:phage baseplate assembly protein V